MTGDGMGGWSGKQAERTLPQPLPAERRLYLEEVLWKPPENEKQPTSPQGNRNFWVVTDSPSGVHLRQTAGINPVARPKGRKRRPAIAIFISPPGEGHRLPWLDEVTLETGFIRYFGDNKPALQRQAETSPGNQALLEQMDLYASPRLEERERAAPLLFFQNLGNVSGGAMTQFLGYGLIKEAHRVTQIHGGRSFVNYAFDCLLFRGDEDEQGREMVEVAWIDDRRNASKEDREANARAPRAWRHWVKDGAKALDDPAVRRVVLHGDIQTYAQQVPPSDSPLGTVLATVYKRFEGSYKHAFQALAALVTELVIGGPGIRYHEGWVTPVGPDGGVDFVQRLDLGHGFSSTKLVVLGQAKCLKPWPQAGNGISAQELARVVARLRRGWIGAYVTTSFFTEQAQRELVIDEYPVVLIPGLRVAQAVEELRDIMGFNRVEELLHWLDGVYERMLATSRVRPSEILREAPDAMVPVLRRTEPST
jgi:hypothetical protein